MKIAVVSTMAGAAWGGSEELWAEMARDALADGHQVSAFLYRARQLPPKLRELRGLGMRVHGRGHSYRLSAERIGGHLLGRPVQLPLVRPVSAFRPLYRLRPDVVLINEGAFFSFLHIPQVCAWLRATRTPYVSLTHFLSESYAPPPGSRAGGIGFYADARTAAFVAQGNLDSARCMLPAALPNARVVRNPVNLAGAGAPPPPPPPSWPVRMASVARLSVAAKGQDVLLRALAEPAWRDRDWHLDLFGGGGDEPFLRELAAQLGLGDRVAFRGHVDDIRAVWAQNHLLVMPSRGEGTPLALVEAMLCGRPAVATDVGGITEWVAEGETGFVAEAPTPRSFGAALERAWAARGEWRRMGERAQRVALELMDPVPGRSLLDLLLAAAGRGAA